MPTAIGQFARFFVVGVINAAIFLGVLNLLTWMSSIYSGILLVWFNCVAFILTLINSYFLNKRWTFDDSGAHENTVTAKFIVVTVIGLAINTAILYILTTVIGPRFGISPAWWVNVSAVIVTGFSLIWNFLGYKYVVFKKSQKSQTL